MNSVNLIGNVGKEIELKQTPSGKSVASFSFAVKDDFDKNKTHWLNCVAWGKTAETLSQYVKKGQQIGISGSISVRSYEDKQGYNRTVTEIVVTNFTFVGKKDKQDNGFSTVEDDEDLPF